MQPFVEDSEILVDGQSVLSPYRKDTASQWGSGGNEGGAVELLQERGEKKKKSLSTSGRFSMSVQPKQTADGGVQVSATCTV